jgi:orotidine-5'-phosphate decarboxylase
MASCVVVGATYPAEIERVRAVAPTLLLLIPGVGAQGGDAAATVKAGWRSGAPIIVNSSRAIIYASSGDDLPRRRGVKPSGRRMCCRPREAEVSRRIFSGT